MPFRRFDLRRWRCALTAFALCLAPVGVQAQLTPVDPAQWDQTAVRKVLHTFAFGSHASDAQIATWAAMPPAQAIEEILDVGPFHPKLDGTLNRYGRTVHNGTGTLLGLSQFWSSNEPTNPIMGETARKNMSLESWRAPERIWTLAAHTPGLNPVRQKIGLYLTNYHMAVNEDAGVNRYQVVAHYDTAMGLLAANYPFELVLTAGAGSAAVAVQYNHRQNRFANGNYRVNQDFAREYFQLFFGILSDHQGEAGYHENVTIPNMSYLLTEMYPRERNGQASTEMVFDTYKTGSPSEVIRQTIHGTNAAERLIALAPHAISHPDSLNNLPVLIVQSLADDKLSDYPQRKDRLRAHWQGMPVKNLMAFLKAYAISTDFHTPERVKYYTSFDRWLILSNRMVTDVEDALRDHYKPQYQISQSGFGVFRPHHDVFGGQTGLDAYGSSDYFMRTLNAHSDWNGIGNLRKHEAKENETVIWTKEWRSFLPPARAGFSCLTAEVLGEWLWQRFIADGLKQFGPLERIQVYSMLNSGLDATYNWKQANIGGVQYDTALTRQELTEGSLKNYFRHQADACIQTDTADSIKNLTYYMGQAVNFIMTTPYAFFQEGR